ncbi:phosphate system positive regulatory protein [Salix suchowensis]|nr:phosphate system positive regulatory protein [Salix suchowensis]
MARASNKPPDALPRTPSKKKTPSKTKDATQNAQLMTPAQDTPGPSTNSLLAQTVLTTDQWYRSRSTKNGYANYVKAGKKWLAEWVEQNTGESSPAGEQGIESEASKLAGAFDVIKEETPLALRLLIAFKCEHQQRGFSTAEGIRAAFKDYFSRYYQPAILPQCLISTKEQTEPHSNSSTGLPMLPADMKVLMDYLDTSEASKNIAEVRRLCWKAFATTSFCLWTRNEELINFKYGDVRMCQESAAGHSYRIPFQKSMPEIDCYTHFVNWIQYLEFQLQRPIDASDYVFPAIASTGKLKFGEPLSRAGFESIMEQIVDNSGIMIGRNGKFTTHCFRRGGAQYRFMWAEHKWSLKAVKWWGGWSSGEEVSSAANVLLRVIAMFLYRSTLLCDTY